MTNMDIMLLQQTINSAVITSTLQSPFIRLQSVYNNKPVGEIGDVQNHICIIFDFKWMFNWIVSLMNTHLVWS